MRITKLFLLSSLAAFLAACNGDSMGPEIQSVQVTPANSTIAPGGTVQLTATALDDAGDAVTDAEFNWTSSNNALATVSTTGLVTGVAQGTVQITATTGGESGSATVVIEIPVASVDVTPTSDTIRSGTSTTLTATAKDASGNTLTGRTITWTSDNPAIATVAAGTVTGVDNGTATISATADGVSGTADISVWVGVTGDWDGSIDAFGGTCGLTFSWDQETDGTFTGTGTLTGPACITVDVDFTGTNNTGGDPDSVEFTWTAAGLPDVDFWGRFDGVDKISGMMDADLDNGPMLSSRISIVPSPTAGPTSAVAKERPVGSSYARPERRDRR